MREQIAVAFFDLVAGTKGLTQTSRRFVVRSAVNEMQMPFLTVRKTGERRSRRDDGSQTLVIEVSVFIYFAASMDPEDHPDSTMNTLLDALDAAVAQRDGGGKQTLGGLVENCYQLGKAKIDTGDVDGKAVAEIPFEIETKGKTDDPS